MVFKAPRMNVLDIQHVRQSRLCRSQFQNVLLVRDVGLHLL